MKAAMLLLGELGEVGDLEPFSSAPLARWVTLLRARFIDMASAGSDGREEALYELKRGRSCGYECGVLKGNWI